ncbi:MAG TPA: hypothetical protein VJN68_06075, partial [Burkholderiaceae bacterium]|nr:hypothetical protein [Burkholderiaceae bacterium]
MEVSRLRLLFLIALAATTLPGCALFRRGEPAAAETAAEPVQQAAPSPVTGEPSTAPVIDPQVERRQIQHTRIDTEDFFLEATVGQSRAGRTSYENLSGSADLLTDSERDYTYYALSAGWNAL